MPRADGIRGRVREGPLPEVVVERSDDPAQFSADLRRQDSERAVQVVTGFHRIAAGAARSGHVQPAAGLAQEAPVPVEGLANTAGPQMAGFGALDGVLCPATEAADRRRGPCGNRLAGADGVWCPTRHRPFELVSCGHPAMPVPLVRGLDLPEGLT